MLPTNVVINMPNEVIDQVHHIADRQKCEPGLTFTRMDGTAYPIIEDDDSSTSDDEQSVNPDDNSDDDPTIGIAVDDEGGDDDIGGEHILDGEKYIDALEVLGDDTVPEPDALIEGVDDDIDDPSGEEGVLEDRAVDEP